MRARRVHPVRHTMEYKAPARVCAGCALRPQCTRAKLGRTLHRHEKQALLDVARVQTHSVRARRDRQRRQQLMEQSFADAANNHHFKRARWRRLWRQQIQDYLIAAIQNVRILLAHGKKPQRAVANIVAVSFERTEVRPWRTQPCGRKPAAPRVLRPITCLLSLLGAPSSADVTVALSNTPYTFDIWSCNRVAQSGVRLAIGGRAVAALQRKKVESRLLSWTKSRDTHRASAEPAPIS